MSLIHDRIEEHKTLGVKAWRGGDMKGALHHFTELAALLARAAESTTGPVREVYAAQARKFVELAKDIEAGRVRRGPEKPGGSASEAAAADEDAGTRWVAAEKPKTRFSDVAGLEAVKDEIRVRMLYPFQHPEKAAKYGVSQGGGILFFGPPGTGKTLLARATAGELDARFYTVKPSEVMSKWVGEAEKNVQNLFAEARRSAPSVIFIDEIESLVPARGGEQSGVMSRLVPQILAELEGFSGRSAKVLFLGATNVPWELDPAVMRPGRFDVHILIDLPDAPAREAIFALELRKTFVESGLDLGTLAARTEGWSGADIRGLCERVANAAFLRSVRESRDEHIDAGDLIEAIAVTRPSVPAADRERYRRWATR